ncbi:MAG: clan AA aspartic protease [Proteobacteria bacterium]|nr:clan AA aspartic protease [Pseudomonadota bacterium]
MASLKKSMVLLFAGIFLAIGFGSIYAHEVIVKTARSVEPFKRQVPWEIDLGDKGVLEVAMINEWGFPIVSLYANKQGPFKFLIDTGADSCILSHEMVKKLALTAIDSKKKEFITPHQRATVDISLFIIEELQLGDVIVKHAPFVATNTATDDFQLLKNLNIVGILGANLFHDVVLTLNFAQQKIVLSDHKEYNHEGTKIKLSGTHYVPMIKAKVQNNENISEYDLLIDSGYTGFVKMPVCFSASEKADHPGSVITYDAFNGSDGGFISELDGTLILGNKKIENPLVKFNIGNCEKRNKWGLIGTQFLQYQTMSIDQKNREVIVH